MSDALTAASAEAIAELQRQQRQQDRATDFTNAFNAHRAVLAGFATCADARELRVVRDGFFLGLGRELCPALYAPVKQQIVEDFRVAAAAGTAGGFAQTIAAARSADGWDALVKAVFAEAEAVGSDLNAIWGGLEAGRLEWLDAVTCAHALKVKLREALAKDGKSGEADVQAAKMVWMYTLALNVPQLQPAAAKWAEAAHIETALMPLQGYKAELWDCRKDEWKPVDVGVQAAAERGGANLDEAWSA